MKQYIDKSALVAEIEKLMNHFKTCQTLNSYEDGLKEGRLIGYEDALDKINSLEIKEMCDIWHDVSERPELEQPLLIVMNGTYKDFRNRYRIGCYGKRGNDIPNWVIDGCYSDSFISKWCYISDILQQDIIETKEVDLERDVVDYIEQHKRELSSGYFDIRRIARHFFELGLMHRKDNLYGNKY